MYSVNVTTTSLVCERKNAALHPQPQPPTPNPPTPSTPTHHPNPSWFHLSSAVHWCFYESSVHSRAVVLNELNVLRGIFRFRGIGAHIDSEHISKHEQSKCLFVVVVIVVVSSSSSSWVTRIRNRKVLLVSWWWWWWWLFDAGKRNVD